MKYKKITAKQAKAINDRLGLSSWETDGCRTYWATNEDETETWTFDSVNERAEFLKRHEAEAEAKTETGLVITESMEKVLHVIEISTDRGAIDYAEFIINNDNRLGLAFAEKAYLLDEVTIKRAEIIKNERENRR